MQAGRVQRPIVYSDLQSVMAVIVVVVVVCCCCLLLLFVVDVILVVAAVVFSVAVSFRSALTNKLIIGAVSRILKLSVERFILLISIPPYTRRSPRRRTQPKNL